MPARPCPNSVRTRKIKCVIFYLCILKCLSLDLILIFFFFRIFSRCSGLFHHKLYFPSPVALGKECDASCVFPGPCSPPASDHSNGFPSLKTSAPHPMPGATELEKPCPSGGARVALGKPAHKLFSLSQGCKVEMNRDLAKRVNITVKPRCSNRRKKVEIANEGPEKPAPEQKQKKRAALDPNVLRLYNSIGSALEYSWGGAGVKMVTISSSPR